MKPNSLQHLLKKRIFKSCFLIEFLLLLHLSSPLTAEPSPSRPVSIENQRQLFTDDVLIDNMQNLSLKLHEPIPREICFYFDRPWEGIVSFCPIVLKEGNRYRMWYRAMDEVPDESGKMTSTHSFTAYAESADGIQWLKPNLGLYEFNGSTENNICVNNPNIHGGSVFRDGNPSAPEDQRYKIIGGGPEKLAHIYGAVSPDGIHWTPIPDPLVIADEQDPQLDTHPSAFWDSFRKKYVLYHRGWYPDHEITGWATDEGASKKRIRAIRFCTSDDFLHWSEWQYIDINEKPWTEHLYTNSAQIYYRAPVYLMFPKRFMPQRKFFPDWPVKGLSDVLFLASRDGVHFPKRFPQAFLRPGLDSNNWHDRTVYIARDVVPTAPGEMSLYILQNYRTPNVHIRRFTLREDGFVSVNNACPAGTLLTKPFAFSGSELEINYSTSAAGHIKIELLHADGTAVPGFEMDHCKIIFGDQISRLVKWEDHPDLAALQNRPVRLRFELLDADLFSFKFLKPDEILEKKP